MLIISDREPIRGKNVAKYNPKHTSIDSMECELINHGFVLGLKFSKSTFLTSIPDRNVR